MRKIADHFTNDRGQAAFHYAVIYADEWEFYGFPKTLTLHQRCVWSYLFHRTCHHHCSVGEIACKVLGSRNNRATIRKVLVSLQKLGLVDQDDDGWYSMIPEIREEPLEEDKEEEVGRNLPQVESYPDDGVESYPLGKNLPPNGVESYQDDGVETDPGRNLPQVESYPPPGRNLPRGGVDTDPMVGRNLPQREIDIERQEETTTTTRDEQTAIAQRVAKVRKVGVDEAISHCPHLFDDPVSIPHERKDYERFMAVAIAISVNQTVAKNEKIGRESSITGLISSITKNFLSERWQAESVIDEYLARRRSKKALEDRREEQVTAARAEGFPAPPPHDGQLDDPEISPVDWIRDRMPGLYERLLELQCSEEEDLVAKLDKASEDALRLFESTTRRTDMRAEQQRKHFLAALNPILMQFESRKAHV